MKRLVPRRARNFEHRLLAVAALGLALTGSTAAQTPAPAPAPAPTPNAAVLDMQKMLDSMGYKTNVVGVFITFNSDNYVLGLTASNDKTVAYLSITYSIPPDKVAGIPMKDLLVFNDSHKRYFSMLSNAKTTQVSLNDQFFVAGIDPKAMRVEIDGIVSDANANQTYFNPTKFK